MTTIIVNDKSDSENLRFDWKLEEDGTLIVEGAYMKGKKIKVPDLYELAFIKTGYKGYNNSESKIYKIEIREKRG